ncbi:hypothetical protein INT46_009614 [Mucor plumbeus]|uniref:Tc1-like transposase DDE domain-containing protein n=1 Tax=Mucor plumbeus TaxID=97098 RepID=A0A8H7RD11_9FUNG|nr:hypothetical protein INT46_009614 [Mucor plumbeus]
MAHRADIYRAFSILKLSNQAQVEHYVILKKVKQNTPFSVIRKRYPSVSLSTLTRYKKKFLSSATLPAGGRPSFVSVSTQQYIARMLRNGRQDGPKAVQEYLRSIEIDMSLSGQKKQASSAAWAKKHQHLTVDQWRQWVFSDETRVNLWGSDGNSYYWSNGGDILQPYQTEPHVEGDGGSVLFLGCITANGPGYGTTVMDGSVDSTVYVDILQTSLLDTLEYYDMDRNVIRFQQDNATPHTSGITQDWFSANGFIFETIRDWPAQSPDLNPIEHVWYQLKRRLNTYPTRPTTKEELEARITSEWYKFTKNDCLKYIDSMPARIKAVIRSGGGPTCF